VENDYPKFEISNTKYIMFFSRKLTFENLEEITSG